MLGSVDRSGCDEVREGLSGTGAATVLGAPIRASPVEGDSSGRASRTESIDASVILSEEVAGLGTPTAVTLYAGRVVADMATGPDVRPGVVVIANTATTATATAPVASARLHRLLGRTTSA